MFPGPRVPLNSTLCFHPTVLPGTVLSRVRDNMLTTETGCKSEGEIVSAMGNHSGH